MRRIMMLIGSIVAIVLVAAGLVALIRIGPRNVWGMLRYDQRRDGDLAVGGQAPDVVLTALDGTTRVRLHEHAGGKPLVLILGSFT